jgi:hypothetical protein
MTPQQISTIGPLMKNCLDFVTEMKEATKMALSKNKKAFQMDEEDIDRMKEMLAKVCDLAT